MGMTCRLCLFQDDHMIPLFYNVAGSNEAYLAQKVTLCTSIAITPSDNFPQQICKNCNNSVNDWVLFRQKCIESDIKLKTSKVNKEEGSGTDKCSSPKYSSGRDSEEGNDIINTDHDAAVNDDGQCVTTQGPKSRKKIGTQQTYLQCCNHTFLTKISYRNHMKECHSKTELCCDECGKKGFSSKVTLRRHKLLHSKRYQCSICSKAFTCKAIMRMHERAAHENDRPYVCDVCGKSFVTALLLTYHQRFHYDERNYICEVCGGAFVTSSGLAKHKVTHSNARPHVCEMCGKGFIVRSRMVQHMRMHTGERPFCCDLCDKKYTSQCKLKRHKKSHNVFAVKQ